jgi:hypothetical protein
MREEIENFAREAQRFRGQGSLLGIRHEPDHVGIAGNDGADEAAVAKSRFPIGDEQVRPRTVLYRVQKVLCRTMERQLSADADVREGTEKPENVACPDDHSDDHDGVQDGLNGALPRDEAMDQLKHPTNDDQNHHDLNQWH